MPITDLVQELMIVKGIPSAIGDTVSAEQPPVSLDLMATGANGWSLESEDGWNPVIPSLKAGGVWADSAISSGRQLLSNEEANVVETMRLTVTGTSAIDLASHMTRMGRMIQDARDFSATFNQVEPVYLRWHAKGAPGPQFALIYNIEMAIVEPDTFSANIRDVTITIEREPYWRPIPPGANPKLWSLYRAGVVAPTLTDLALLGTSAGQLATDTLENRREWNTTQTALVSNNAIDIPAASIPGDAPALVEIALRANSATQGLGTHTMIYVTSKTLSYTAKDGTTRPVYHLLNAGDGDTGTDATIAADTGAPFSNSQASGQRVAVSFATATQQERLRWTLGSGLEALVDLSSFRGRYAAFLRCRLSASSSVDLNLFIRGQDNALQGLQLPTQTITGALGTTGTGNTTTWQFLYMGQFSIPFDDRRIDVGVDGRGVWIPSNASTTRNLVIAVTATRTGGATVLYMADLLLVPVDEGSVDLGVEFIGATTDDIVYDNTGYLTHGQPGATLRSSQNSTGANPDSEKLVTSIQGGELYLRPNVVNRIGFYTYTTGPVSRIDYGATAYVNIVPRWRYIRNV